MPTVGLFEGKGKKDDAWVSIYKMKVFFFFFF